MTANSHQLGAHVRHQISLSFQAITFHHCERPSHDLTTLPCDQRRKRLLRQSPAHRTEHKHSKHPIHIGAVAQKLLKTHSTRPQNSLPQTAVREFTEARFVKLSETSYVCL